MAYDSDNVFAKIVRGEIPSDKVEETDATLAFRDLTPQAPVHVLVIPKGPYEDLGAFAEQASDREIADWVRTASRVASRLGVAESGFRVLANSGSDGGQEVPHLHLHLFGGARLGPMILPES
jgi:diadenosine tetraphosphate (Ap4A) HIT family hydrolase